ncbi:winged helix-turn-helix domain-containing protein [Blautia sp. RD014234]|nr:winged helix-turn-helix domain-containing protein [Blautia parvula]
MKKDKGLYELIYEYYESRILFGYYKYGDSLSSVSVICSTFQVGRNTVRAALAKLEEKGYIVTEERRAAEVVYRGTSEEFEKMPRIILCPAGMESGILPGRERFYFCLFGRPVCADWTGKRQRRKTADITLSCPAPYPYR